jgi:hypothetical protein
MDRHLAYQARLAEFVENLRFRFPSGMIWVSDWFQFNLSLSSFGLDLLYKCEDYESLGYGRSNQIPSMLLEEQYFFLMETS